MPTVAATKIAEVVRAFTSEDGQFMALILEGDEGEEINLAIPRNEMLKLIPLAAHCYAEVRQDNQYTS